MRSYVSVKRAAELFSADEVEVSVAMPTVPDRVVLGDSASIRHDGPRTRRHPSSNYPIAVPLIGHDGTGVGEIRLLFRDKKISLTEREQYTFRAFAAALSTAIRNAAAFAETKRLSAQHEHAARHDPLTGLAKRRQLYTEATHSSSTGQPTATSASYSWISTTSRRSTTHSAM